MKNTAQNYELADLGIRVFYVLNERVPADLKLYSRHTHKHSYYELHIILEGKCVLQTEDNVYTVEAGQFVLVSPGVYHKFSNPTDLGDHHCISFELSKKMVPTAEKLYIYTKENPVWIGDGASMLNVVKRLQIESDQERIFSEEIKYMLNRMILLDLLREIEVSALFSNPGRSTLVDEKSMLIDIFLNCNYHMSAGEEELANFLGLSRRQLGRILKKMYGKGYREKIIEIRSEVACDLLCHSNLSIREISEQVGYSTPSNFIAFFRKAVGVTPVQYRESHKTM